MSLNQQLLADPPNSQPELHCGGSPCFLIFTPPSGGAIFASAIVGVTLVGGHDGLAPSADGANGTAFVDVGAMPTITLGGAVLLDGLANEVLFSGVSFRSFTATMGGAVVVRQCAVRIINCVFYNNTATLWGGALAVLSGKVLPPSHKCASVDSTVEALL